MASYGSSSLRETDTKKAKYLNISILSFLYPDPHLKYINWEQSY